MRHRLAAIAIAGTLGAGALASGTAAAAAPANHRIDQAGARCVVEGVTYLAEHGLLRDAALRRIDYSTLANPTTGPIFTTLPPGSFLSLGEVIRLHYTDPQLFAWCR
jgi:hypothetical protein